MELKDIKAVYFIGAGGIGMSAIARYFMKRGLVVAGYDKTPSNLTHQLEKEGMVIHYEEDIAEIPNTSTSWAMFCWNTWQNHHLYDVCTHHAPEPFGL